MTDLRANLFYKVKFTIAAKDDTVDLLWNLIWHIKEWQTKKWNRIEHGLLSTDNLAWTKLKSGGQLLSSDQKTVHIRSEACMPDGDVSKMYWACQIIENRSAEAGYAPRQWVTEIGFEPVENGKATFSCVIAYSDRAGFIGLCEPAPGLSVPNLIRRLLSDKRIACINGMDSVSMKPQMLNPEDWVGFWERLQDKRRTLPYIYVSPGEPEEVESQLSAEAEKLAIAAGGNALVFYATDRNIEASISACCPDGFGCYHGTVRIYAPELRPDDPANAIKHRYLSAGYIRKNGANSVAQIIRRAFAQDVSFYESFFRIEDCREMRASILRKKRLEELNHRHMQDLERAEAEHMGLAMEEEQKRLIAEDNYELLKLEMEDLRNENYRLSQENASYRPMFQRVAELERAGSARMENRTYPDSPMKILCYFEREFGDRLSFTDEAKKTVKDCTIPEADLWNDLFALATEMWDLRFHGSGDIFAEFRSRTGIDASRGEGKMTRRDSKLMKQFTVDYNGETIDIEAHITFPKLSQSIHFGFSEQTQKVVIGSCGEHMEIYSTRKHK